MNRRPACLLHVALLAAIFALLIGAGAEATRAQPAKSSPEQGGGSSEVSDAKAPDAKVPDAKVPDAKAPVYAVPFAAEGNLLRLTLANRTGQRAQDVAVVAEAVPPWITLAAPRRAAGALAEGDEATVTFTFDVAREAPVGEVQALRFAVQSAGGALATKTIRLRVQAPRELALEGNWPNPFAGRTTIGYRLPRAAEVQVAVYDLLGRRVALIEEGLQPPGAQTLSWQARGLASGVYLYRLTATPAGGSSGSGPGGAPMVRHGRMTLVR